MRSFVAIELPDQVVGELTRLGREVRRLAPAWAGERWVAPLALHVTVKFLGELDTDGLDALSEDLTGRLADIGPAAFTLQRLRAVPSPRRATMLWAVPAEEPPSLSELATLVDAAAVEVGVPADERPFSTHVTLVRARRPRRIQAEALEAAWQAVRDPAAEKDQVRTPVGSVSEPAVTVFTSTLTRSGPIYERWSRVPLGRA